MEPEDNAFNSFMYLWNSENTEAKSSFQNDSRPIKTVETLRFRVGQLQYMKNSTGALDGASWFKQSREFMTEYGTLMDNQVAGLNNYAEPILSLLGNNRNESKKWSCNLSAKEVIKKYIPGDAGTPTTKEEEDMKLLAQQMNTAEDNIYIHAKEELPTEDSEEVTTSNPRDLRMERSSVKPSFNLMDDDDDDNGLLKENVFPAKRVQNLYSLGQEDNSFSKPSINTFQTNSVPSQGRGQNSNRSSHYPWNRVSAPNAMKDTSSQQGTHMTKSNFFNQRGQGRSFAQSRKSRREESVCGESFEDTNKYPGDMSSATSDQSGRERKSYFKTATHQMALDQQKKHGQGRMNPESYGASKRSLGVRRSVNNKFVPPVRRPEDEEDELLGRCLSSNANRPSGKQGSTGEDSPYAELMQDERLKNIEPKMVELIMNEIMDSGPAVNWKDIAGLELAKKTIQEIVVWPMLRPDIFTGLRGPPKGILLFGPPGTGKTMIGKCIASQSGSTFFSISASSLTSKWVGEGEKMVRAMFAVARCHQPAVIFIDEIDSLLTQRSDTEHESSRRIKTEFLVQLDGATSGGEERLLVVGATNRPQELDEAARRRLVKRLYIPLPDTKARQSIVINLMENQNHSLTGDSVEDICEKTDGYSGADMANLCREAALGPIRSINFCDIQHISVDQVRPISAEDFISALCSIRASVSDKDLQMYEDWNSKYGISAR